MSRTEVQKAVNGSTQPLTEEQVKKNQEKYGPNALAEGKKKTVPQIFLEQYKDFMVIILIIAAIVSGILGETESAIVILIVITINAILGTVQTVKAEQSLNSLKAMSAPEAKVVRGGDVIKIPSSQVTIGDIVMLEAGDYVPADGRILENASLKVDESALTGESLSVEKMEDAIEGEVPLGDRTNMVFSGSFVSYGRGSFLVTGIGMNTEVGKIASLLKSTSEKKTPLQMNLDNFGQKLSILILVFCAILFAISVFRGEGAADAFLFAVALAVAAIPEALSSIVTIVLSFGTQKMAKEHAIIRKLQAVEGLGSVSIICSDKTGTLTQNKMTVEDYYVEGKEIPADSIDLEDEAQKQLLRHSILCNDSTNKNGEEIRCSKVEYQLLMYFMENRGQVLSKEQILEHVWDSQGKFVDENTLSVNIRRLRGKIEDDPNFSFSGLKTSLRYYLQKMSQSEIQQAMPDICASYQFAVIEQLRRRTEFFARQKSYASIGISGGVSNNSNFADTFEKLAKRNRAKFLVADKEHRGDNAAMIAFAAFFSPNNCIPSEKNTLKINPSWQI